MKKSDKEWRVVKVSGGRTSAFLAETMLRRGDDIDRLVFTNTAMETPETYEFLSVFRDYLKSEFGRTLTLLEYSKDDPGFREVAEVSELKKNGEVFLDMFYKEQSISGLGHRECTPKLKVRTSQKYMAQFGATKYNMTNCLGLRADEPRRVAKVRIRNELLESAFNKRRRDRTKDEQRVFTYADGFVQLPLAEAGFVQADVYEYLRGLLGRLPPLSFDIMDDDLHVSNCAGCFFHDMDKRHRALDRQPNLRRVWEEMESTVFPRDEGRDRATRNALFLRAFRHATDRDFAGEIPQGFWSHRYPVVALAELDAGEKRKGEAQLSFDFCDDGSCGDGV